MGLIYLVPFASRVWRAYGYMGYTPKANGTYEYNTLGGADYELCAVFSTDTDKSGEADRAFSGRAWDHAIGRTCFPLKAEYVDPGPKPLSTITQLNPPPAPTPTPVPMPTVQGNLHEETPQGPGVEIGTGYPYALYVHCGIRDARFDGRLWMADPMLSDGSGNPPPDWTADDSRGTMELVRDDLAVFTAESGRIVEFIPWCKGRSNNGPVRRSRALRSGVDAQRFCPPKCHGKMSSM